MFETYCTSYYGCPLWRLEGNTIKQFFTTWRKCVRKVWEVPRMTHCRILNHLCQGPCIEAQILCRYLAFCCNAINSENQYVQMCSSLCIFSNTSAALNRSPELCYIKLMMMGVVCAMPTYTP